MLKNRYISNFIDEKLKERMVFLGGPRQVGKTTLSLHALGTDSAEHPGYLNWDYPGVAKKLLEGQIPLGQSLLVFDEIHKYRKWRALLKGLYDVHKARLRFLITGSARLDYYRHGGDSLFGRYHYVRLHPFSVCELGIQKKEELNNLLKFGGFPEPLFRGDDTFLRQWQRERRSRVIDQDLRDLEQVRDISNLRLLAELLPSRVGSLLSINSLREDLSVDFKTVANWIDIFDNLYYSFRISPFGSPKIKALKKEQKLYLWDYSVIPEIGPRFENCVASHLLKYCHAIEDISGHEMELRYLRDVQKHEIDFVVLKDKIPIFAVECKAGEKSLSPHIRYFKQRTDIKKFYQVHLGDRAWTSEPGVEVLPFIDFCYAVGIP